MKKALLSLIVFLMSYGFVFGQYSRASLWTSNINSFAAQDALNGVPSNVVLFAGSSTFTMWSSLKTDFPNSNVLNRAFGGSWMTDLIYYFGQVVAPYTPTQVLLYEGDNDLYGTTKTAEEFMDDVVTMTRMINIYYPNAKILLVSIKPSPSRTSAFPKYQAANALMQAYANKTSYIDYVDTWTPMLNNDGTPNTSLFGSDMLHMNTTGYALWKSILEPLLDIYSGPGPVANDKVIFTESSHATYHDPSWVNVTSPSTFTTSKAEKISCDSTRHHNGETSLKIAYQGVTGGSWKACIAADSWAPYDITDLKELEFYVYADAIVDSINFPYVYLESYTSTTTNKLRLSNYISQIPAATWTKVTIPVADFIAISPSFTYDNVKTIFFSQLNTNANPIVFYVDDVVYRADSGTTGSGDGTGDILIDFGSDTNPTTGNWNNVTDHQSANQALIDDQGASTGITLKVTDPFYNGFNTSGTASPTGDASIFPSTATADNFFGHGLAWGSTPANPEGIIELSGLNSAKYYSFTIFASRTGVTDNRETKYTLTGVTPKTGNLNPSNNATNVLHIDSIMPDNSGKITIKCEAGPNNDNANKFYFLGAMKIVQLGNNTGLSNIKMNNLTVSYNNEVLNLKDYSGSVKIYSANGVTIKEGQTTSGYMGVKLDKGTYLVKTESGVAKLLVR